MANEIIPYHKMSVLIIEDLAEMRSTMKSMLAALGVQTMETVNNGEEALAKMRLKTYNIVFSDYELGRGKDGQQILEEARYSSLVPASTTYIVVSAAQTADMVMGVLEYEPDGYIAKPVTLDILRTRLNRIVRTKSIYKDINRYIDKKDISGALEACNRLALEKPKFALPAYRIKGKLLIQSNRLDEAKEMYETVMGIKKVAWAVLGMGKVEYLQGNYDSARALLESLANTNRKFVEAFDWLAKTLEAQGQYKAAQQVLNQAIEESPKSVLRQQELARLAELNADGDTMYKASRKAYALSKNSVFRNADGLIRYALSLQPTIRHGSGRDQKLALKDVSNIIETVRTEFELNFKEIIRCAIVEALSMSNSGNKEAGKLALDAALSMAAEPDVKLDTDIRLDLFSAQLICEEDENKALAEGEKLLQEIGQQHRLQSRYYAILDIYYVGKPKRLELLEERGTDLLERKLYEDAHQILSKALRLDSENIELKFKSLKAVVNLYKSGQKSSENLEYGNQLFRSLEHIGEKDPHFSTLEKLRLQWNEHNN